MNWKQYNRTNNLLGWFVFVVATLTYLLTISHSASLWDCAEFIACDYKLEIGHPPGAPFYMLVYNVMSHLGGGAEQAALMTNVTSAVLSGLTILFLFWTISHMVRRVVSPKAHLGEQGLDPIGEVVSRGQAIAIFGSALVGSLTYTFSDSFWFSAVEAEVYAFSSLFTAVVFWLIFKWEERSAFPRSDRWLILIAYLMGLSIGVHLLNLLCLPAMALVFYYRKAEKPTVKGAGFALLASFALVGLMMYGVVLGVPKMAGHWDRFFVNGLGFSYNVGIYAYIAILALVLIWGVYETQRALRDAKTLSSHRLRLAVILSLVLMGIPLIGNAFVGLVIAGAIGAFFYLYKGFTARALHLVQMCLVAIAIGFSSYGVILVRAVADPPMNENSPGDAFSLRYYLAREQYGSAPLFYGPTFASSYVYGPDGRPVLKEGEPIYGRIDKTDASQPDEYVVRSKKEEPEYESAGMMLFPRVYDRGHAQMYNSWMGREDNDMTIPTFGDNLTYFFNYQVNYMYWRYFLWNFAGRQNDLMGDGGLLRGGAMTGIPFIDSLFYGDTDSLPEAMTDNKGHNVYYALPLLLGILGLFWQINKGKRGVESFWITFMLFFMTGLAIVLYLNQYPGQPRERDYAYVGSFYAFAIWIGFGVAALSSLVSDLLANKGKKKTSEDAPLTIHPMYAAIVTLLAVLVPIQMAGQNWDDHDRSGRSVASDMGRNYLESCDKNAVLFCYGDNDTFPLWYAQEVEGVRTDIRTVNLSYLSGDWYIDQMKKQAYDGKPLPLGRVPKSYYYYNNYALLNSQSAEAMPVAQALEALKHAAKDQPAVLPTDRFIVRVDSTKASSYLRQVHPQLADAVEAGEMELSLQGRQYLDLAGLSVLDLIEGNAWERPIYWAITSPRNAFNGMTERMVQTGMTSQLLPIVSQGQEGAPINAERMYQTVMTKFRWCGADRPGTYFDENARGIVATLRNQVFTPLAKAFLAQNNKAKAQEVLRKSLAVILEENVPYELSSLYFAEALYQADMPKEGDRVLRSIARKAMSVLVWASQLSPEKLNDVARHGDLQEAYTALSYALDLAGQFGSNSLKPYEEQIGTLLSRLGAPQR